MMVIGVDPGLTGAISLIGGRCEYLACEDIPTCGNGIETGSMKRWVNAGALDEMLMNWSSQ